MSTRAGCWAPVVATFVIGATLGGCSHAETPVGAAREPIINGVLDTSHDAVVVVAGPSITCTATIVHTDGSMGAALTAASCVDAVTVTHVLQGDDVASPDVTHSIVDTEIHPGWDPSGPVNDFALVWFTGASAATPAMPVVGAATDPSAPGLAVTALGYGLSGPPPGTSDTRRRRIGLTLGTVSSTELTLDVSSGGPCSGDSGGPVLADVGGVETIIGVSSYGDASCESFAVAGRVSSVQPWLADALGIDPCASGGCDAGAPASDGGAPPPDAGAIPDAGASSDAEVFADASVARDGGSVIGDRRERDRGCGCVAAGAPATPIPLSGTAALVVSAIAWRRRRALSRR